MSEEIRKIVNMLSHGRINNDEAVRLIEAATKTAPADLGGAMYSQAMQPEGEDMSACRRPSSRKHKPLWRKVALLAGVLFLIAIVCVQAWGSTRSPREVIAIVLAIVYQALILYLIVRFALRAHRRHGEASQSANGGE